jgi:uncharacterized protein YcbX
MDPTLSGLIIYPVKGCRGLSLSESRIDPLGLLDDRRFMVVEPNGMFLTQRTLPRMALIEPQLSDQTLSLTGPSFPAIQVAREAVNAPRFEVQVWKSTGLSAEDCGDPVAAWLTDFLGHPARLARIGAAFHRPILKETAQSGDSVSFADGYPFLAISESSLQELNGRLSASIPMNRFRPNFILRGSDAFAEDTWRRFTIGEITFRAGGPCARCIVTTVDQQRGEPSGPEPLRTLATYRRDLEEPTNVNFGQNLIHETLNGTIRIGDKVTVLEA